jgi:pyruvoyl-dependent arginine decarboxylase (PvlArgDC)
MRRRKFWFGYDGGNVVFWVMARDRKEARDAAIAAGLGRPDWVRQDRKTKARNGSERL